MITIEIKNDQITPALVRVQEKLADASDVMNEIGMFLVNSTQQRLGAGSTPEGGRFAPRSPVTLAVYQAAGASFGGVLHKSGDMRKEIGHTYGPDFVAWGSPAVYAAMMQFGGTRAQFPNLWGDIPARPFLGVSQEDEVGILEIISEALERVAKAGS